MTPTPQPAPPQPPTPYAGGSNAKYCQKCGAPNDPNAAYCMQCGEVNFGQMPPGRISRPTGVTIIAVLQIIGALGTLAIGVGATAILGGFFAAFGLIFLIMGVLSLIAGIALFSGRNWARILALVFAVLELFAIGLGTIIGIIMLYYLTRPRVVAFFKQPRAA